MKNIREIIEKIYNNEELRETCIPLFLGNPGIGKTQIIKEFAKDVGANMIEFIASTRNPFEISGLAMPNKERDRMVYLDYDMLESLKDGDIIFFDEILNGNPAVLNACLTLLESRQTISGKKLPKVMIIAAANPQGNPPLTPQIKERFIWYDVSFDSLLWRDYMKKKYSMPVNISSMLVTEIKQESFDEYNYYTPRSIEKTLMMLLKDVPLPREYQNIEVILNTVVDNELKEDIEITPGVILKADEKISWLKLVKYAYNQ